MNHPDPDRRETVRQVLSALGHEQAELDEARFTAQTASGHAQQAQAMARAELAGARARERAVARLQGLLAEACGRSHGLRDMAAQAQAQAATSAAQTAAAALAVRSTVQAMEAVAADVGAALNLTAASLQGTEVQHHVSDTWSCMVQALGEARRASTGALAAAARSAEVMAAALEHDAAAVQAGFDGLQALTQQERARIARQVGDAQQRVSQTAQAICATQASLAAAAGQSGALGAVGSAIRPTLNFNLVVEPEPDGPPGIRFDAIPDTPVPPALEAPQPATECHLALVPAELADLVSLELAEQCFARAADAAPGAAAPFIAVQPRQAHRPTVDHDVDLFGRPLIQAQDYVALLLVQPSRAYKQWLGDFSDALSAPSTVFTLGKALPAADASSDTAPRTGAEIPVLDTAQCAQAEIGRLRIGLDRAQRELGPLQVAVDALTAQSAMLDAALTTARASQNDVLSRLRSAADLAVQGEQLQGSAGTATAHAERAHNSVHACMAQMASVVGPLTLTLALLRKAAQRAGKAKQKSPLVPDDLIEMLDKATALGAPALAAALQALGCCSTALSGAARLKALMQTAAGQAQALMASISGGHRMDAETSGCDNGQASLLTLLQHEHGQIQGLCASALDASRAAAIRLGVAQTRCHETATRVGSLSAGLAAACAAAAAD